MLPKPPLSRTADLNLDFYRKRAKALLKAARAGDPAANERLRRHGAAGEPALHAAQLAVAREQGFASWPRLHAFITESQFDLHQLVARFVMAAMEDGGRARTMLADHPELAQAGVYPALVLGDWRRVAAIIETDPQFAHETSGPENVEPIIYVCFSRFGYRNSERAADLALTLRLLLNHGADPDTALAADRGPLSCLYAVSGLLNNPEMTRILLEAGADPDDNESLYHATEHSDLECLRLLLDHGASTRGNNALRHMLDRESPEGVRLLLEGGADPNESSHWRDTALHYAVRRERSAEVARLLVEAGVDIDAVRADGRTAYALALISGQTDVAQMLAAHGADTRLSPLDAFVAGEEVPVPPESANVPGNAFLLCALAEAGNVTAVERLLKAGVPVDARGGRGETALHWACWKGNGELIRLLIREGAPLEEKDRDFHAEPSGWLHHGAATGQDGDHARGARLLIHAGASMAGCRTPSGNEQLDAVLRDNGLI